MRSGLVTQKINFPILGCCGGCKILVEIYKIKESLDVCRIKKLSILSLNLKTETLRTFERGTFKGASGVGFPISNTFRKSLAPRLRRRGKTNF
jgi:hypothetical protein